MSEHFQENAEILKKYLTQGKLTQAVAVMESYTTKAPSTGRLLLTALQDCLVAGDQKAVEDFCEFVPRHFAFRGMCEYALACIRGRELQIDKMSSLVREGLKNVAIAKDFYKDDPAFMSGILPFMTQQANLFEPADIKFDKFIDEPKALFNGGGSTEVPNDNGLVFSACNGKYLERYFRGYADSLFSCGSESIIHIHVVNPTAASDEIIKDLTKTGRVFFSTEESKLGPCYFASSRMLLLPKILEHYNRDVIVSDIDIKFIRPPEQILAQLGEKHFGCFKKITPAPNLTYHAQLLAFKNSPQVIRFMERVNYYLRGKLAEQEIWTVDQTALIWALGVGKKADRDFKSFILDLNNIYPSIDTFQIHDQSTDIKRQLRDYEHQNNLLEFALDENGKPYLSKVEE